MPALGRRYRQLSTLAERAGRTTQVAQDLLLARTVVLKLAPAGTPDAAEVEAEAARLGQLGHPSLVRLVDRFQDNLAADESVEHSTTVTGFATLWVDGLPLGRAQRDRPLAERLAAFGSLVEAVSYLHRCGLLHLDLKPSNVLWTDAGVQVLDLGTARPIGTGAGQAGGTLGFAAPEVIEGHAAGVQADIYSLGALLYELAGGARPFGAATGSELRRSVLAGDLVPLRACWPQADRELARLVEAMLARSPVDRPRSMTEVDTALQALGIPVPLPRGEPPFVGRSDSLRELRKALARRGEVLVIGPEGAGRRRLLSQVLLQGSYRVLDLSEQVDPRLALGRLAAQIDPALPTHPDHEGWAKQARAALSRPDPDLGIVIMGRREVQPAQRLAVLDDLAAALVRGGRAVVWIGRGPLPGRAVVEIPPMSGLEVASIGHFYQQALSVRLPATLARTGGWPGAVIRSLSPEPLVLPQDQPACKAALAALQGLPDGIPPQVLRKLPAVVQEAVPALEEAGLLRRAADGRVFLARVEGELPADPELRSCLAALLDSTGMELESVWEAVLASRLGRPVDLERLAPPGRDIPSVALDGVGEVARRQIAAGDPRAWSLLARVRLSMSDFAGAVDALDQLVEEGPDDRVVRVQALRRTGRTEEAQVLLQALLALPRPPGLAWYEHAQAALAAGDLDEVERALEKVREAYPRVQDLEPVLVESFLILERARRGLPVEGQDRLLAWTRRTDISAPDRVTVIGRLAEVAFVQGDLEGALALRQVQVRLSDEVGTLRPAAGSRLNVANVLIAMGRIREARRLLDDALVIASRSEDQALRAQIFYNLARLDMRAGRLPDAEVWLDEFDRATAGMSWPEITLRRGLNRAWWHLLRSEAEPAHALLVEVTTENTSTEARQQRLHLLAWSLLELGRPEEVLAVLENAQGDAGEVAFRALAESLRGRAHLALGRRHLADAASALGDEQHQGMEMVAGEVLLAWAGEDLDPRTFPERREALGRAARYLRGPLAARAIRLRERMLDGPGANLDGIVALTEAMHEPRAFPEALARLVREALGAHRVLIMLRMPGLGHQLGYSELSGVQAAGIGREVMQRITRPDDVWISGDAFADPQLRESSQTVQTFELKSLLAVAIPRGDRAIGALYVDDLYRVNRFDEDDVALLKRLAGAVGRMIPMMRSEGPHEMAEPTDILGVLLADEGHLHAMRDAIGMLPGATEANVLITGPTGAGKSVLAHRLATEVLGLAGVEVVVLRKSDPQMLITQLKGSRRGEFTGAADREGAIDRCLRERKALFLDEIQNLGEDGQQILLPLLDLPRSFGGLTASADRLRRPLHVLLGTNQDVSGAQAFDVFRQDLWFRMSRIHVHLPPLGERGAEVVYQYLARMLADKEAATPEELFETGALYRVTNAPWPGNLRELDAFAERAAHMALSKSRQLRVDDLGALRLTEEQAPALQASSEGGAANLDHAMLRHVLSVLRRHRWVQKPAADELGMNPPALNKLLKRNGLLDEVRRRRQLDA